jgi:hypothetical protein
LGNGILGQDFSAFGEAPECRTGLVDIDIRLPFKRPPGKMEDSAAFTEKSG